MESTSEHAVRVVCVGSQYTIMTRWSQLQNGYKRLSGAAIVYHNDSVESTSEHRDTLAAMGQIYTIMTRWSQLQNEPWPLALSPDIIP